MNEVIVTGRRWNNPEIYAQIGAEGIEMQIKVSDFIHALIEEIGSPALVFKKETLKKRAEAAAERILTEVRTASRAVI